MTVKQIRQPKGRPTGGQFAAEKRAEADLHLTPPRPNRKPKGSTATVTLPDGTVLTGWTGVGRYTHAVVLPPEDPELVRKARHQRLHEITERIALIDEVLAETGREMSIRSNHLHAPGEDPDLNLDGTARYHGFTVRLYSLDRKTVVAEASSNSHRICQGSYDPDTGEYRPEGTQHARDFLAGRAAANRAELIAEARGHWEALGRLDDGTYDLGEPKVVRWAGSEEEAACNAERLSASSGTRRPYTVPVDA